MTKRIKFGDFTLASGKKAKYYLDGKQVTLDSIGLKLVGEGLLDLLAHEYAPGGRRHVDRRRPNHCGGGDSGRRSRRSALGFHGPQRSQRTWHRVASSKVPVKPGDEAVIVEDVVTTGGSSLLAIERAEQFGLKVTRGAGHHRPHGRGRRSLPPARLRLGKSLHYPGLRHRTAELVFHADICARPNSKAFHADICTTEMQILFVLTFSLVVVQSRWKHPYIANSSSFTRQAMHAPKCAWPLSHRRDRR